jgi:uncharacterized protein DUF4203
LKPVIPDEFFGLITQDIGAGVAIGLGALYCFFGYRALKLVLGLTGFVIAGCVAAMLVGFVTEGHSIAMLVAGLIGGIAGAVALFFLYKAGVFCVGLLGGIVVASAALTGVDASWIIWAVLGAGLVGGIIALAVERPVMTLATAALGAALVVAGIIHYLGMELDATLRAPEEISQRELGILAGWAALGLVGAITQFLLGRSKAGGPPKGAPPAGPQQGAPPQAVTPGR